MDTNIVRIGRWNIEVPKGHIYNYPNLSETYDYVPWNLIGKIISENDIADCRLLDVGANVGDSLAHFRRFSIEEAICVEASVDFFSILERNSRLIGGVTLVNKLLAPPDLAGHVKFTSGDQTGGSALASEGDQAWEGPSVCLDELIPFNNGRYVFKTDTDGFDGILVQYMCRFIDKMNLDVPIIFFEGPSQDQIISGDFSDYMRSFDDLFRLDYHILLLTNHGMPYGYAGSSRSATLSMLNALRTGYQIGRAPCHYFDVIAVREKYLTPSFKLSSPWAADLFRRD